MNLKIPTRTPPVAASAVRRCPCLLAYIHAQPHSHTHIHSSSLARALFVSNSCQIVGGLRVGIPGSHKANVTLPDHYRNLDEYIDENVRPIGCKAGDCIIFTEALSESLPLPIPVIS